MTQEHPINTRSGSFAVLGQPLFAVMWVAAVLGNTGSFIRDVASAWLMTDLSPSPAAVAMVQAAATLPVFLLAIPAGVLADTLDRRKLLIGIQLLLASTSLALMLLSASGHQSVTSLIALTFLGGIGAALMGPAWQTIVPELVKKQDLRNAVALNSLGINISRAIGPALGGMVLASLGAAYAYGLDVLSYVFVIAALWWWKRPEARPQALDEHFGSAFRAGLRYVRASPDVHTVLLRAFLFFLMASAVWALLPLVARQLLQGDAAFYGVLLGAVGAGAIAGALILPTLRERLSSDGLMLLSACLTSTVMLLLSLSPPQALAVALLVVLGMAWITALTTLNGVAQSILPNWVRGRSLAVYLTVFNGAMTLGSLGWGSVAQGTSVPMALCIAAAGMVAIGLLAHRIRLPSGDADLEPANHWPEPLTEQPVEHDRGPVMIQVEYRVSPEQHSDFLKVIHQLSVARRRDGAYLWGVAEDTSDANIILEWFMIESWGEHLRQHKRVSKADADLQQRLRACLQAGDQPVVRHFVAFSPPK